MNNAVLFAILVVFCAAARIEGGQLRSVCILIPAYNAEEYAEGENEEEEVRGWGPGPSSGINNIAPGATIVTHSNGDGVVSAEGAKPLPVPSGEGGGGGGGVQGSMTDPSKPPGPNPRWGYWEWDSESGRWELEDFKRRRRRQVAGAVLAGKLQCGPGTVIHVDKVTLGFSITNQCSPVRPVCQATSTLGRQVAHCEGQTGACAVSVEQKYMTGCGRRTNYANIYYECIPEAERNSICQSKTFHSDGSLVLASPSFAGSGSHAYLSCECEVSKGSNSELEVAWARANLDTGVGDACGDEMLLVDTWDDASNRFKLQEELCGLRSLRGRTFSDSVVKFTFIPSPAATPGTGFMLKIQGNPNIATQLRTTCSLVTADGNPVAPPPVPSSDGLSNLQLPAHLQNIDPALLNKTLSEFRIRMAQQGTASGMVGTKHEAAGSSLGIAGTRQSDNSGTDSKQNEDNFDVKGTSGTLSAVVASLASVIVVLGSVGMYLWYRRRQRKRKQNEVYYDSRATVRSDVTLYAEATYQDPAGPGSNIPTVPPPPPRTSVGAGARVFAPRTAAAFKCAEKSAAPRERRPSDALLMKSGVSAAPSGGVEGGERRRGSSDGHAPVLPTRPPRTKKDKVRSLKTEDETPYDNAAGAAPAKKGKAPASPVVTPLPRDVNTSDDETTDPDVTAPDEHVAAEPIYSSLDDIKTILASEGDAASLTSLEEEI